MSGVCIARFCGMASMLSNAVRQASQGRMYALGGQRPIAAGSAVQAASAALGAAIAPSGRSPAGGFTQRANGSHFLHCP